MLSATACPRPHHSMPLPPDLRQPALAQLSAAAVAMSKARMRSAQQAPHGAFWSPGSGGGSTFRPGTLLYQAAKHCECCAATPAAAPLGPRKTMGQLMVPPLMYSVFAALLMIWSMAAPQQRPRQEGRPTLCRHFRLCLPGTSEAGRGPSLPLCTFQSRRRRGRKGSLRHKWGHALEAAAAHLASRS